MLMNAVIYINWFILCYFVLLAAGYIFLLINSLKDVFMRYMEIKVDNTTSMTKVLKIPAVTVMMAAFNEEDNIIEAVESVLNSDYTNTHLLIVNDGSTDNTLELLINKYKLYKTSSSFVAKRVKIQSEVKGVYLSHSYSNITVIDKTHYDKSDSLNVALDACRTPLFVTVDADSIIEPETISEMVLYLLTQPHIVAVGGSVYILNDCKVKDGKIIKASMPYSYLLGMQACEYLRSFIFARSGWNSLGGALSFSGTMTLLETEEIVELGGFDLHNDAYDFEIVTRLHARKIECEVPYQIGYTSAASAWTDVPATFKTYWNQRVNWQVGTMRSLLLHKKMLFNPKYGLTGFFTYPFFLFGDALAPVVEFVAYLMLIISWSLGILDGYGALLLFVTCLGFITLLTMANFLISLVSYNKYQRIRDIPWVFCLSVIELFGFHQYNVICRVVGTIRYFFVKRPSLSSVGSA